jgi:iron complex outermembrane receptor protein
MAALRLSICAVLTCAMAGSQAVAQAGGGQARDTAVTLHGVRVVAELGDARVAPLQLTTLPAISSVALPRIEESVNLLDTEDAVKYLPSVFLRKRNNGDTQATMATRVWGVSSSARSLVFADGVPLSALVANNNTIGGPRWGMVGPAEIARIDMMYGPFSAAYAGNSMGAVMEITTRMPQRREGSLSQTVASQSFSLYGTSATYPTLQTTGSYGDRFGAFAFWLSGNYQKSESQPLTYVTSATFPSGTTGGYPETNKLSSAANVLGAGGLLHTGMTNGKVKVAYDLTPTLRASYTYGWWQNDADAHVQSYVSKAGTPSYAGQAGFASGYYDLIQQHSAHALSLRTDNGNGDWDYELVATRYRFDRDRQRSPSSASSTDTSFSAGGRVAVYDGTGWETFDAKASWHRGGLAAARHAVSFGAHQDGYTLDNPTYATADWRTGALGAVTAQGSGKTRTRAVWMQDAWRFAPAWRLTLGARIEDWRAYDGYNQNGATKVTQPELAFTRVSPKAVLGWTPSDDWSLTASLGKAYRFATTAELYQLVTTGATFTAPNPNLKPDDVLAAELRGERRFARGRVQLALFNDDIHDAMISQFLPLVAGSSTLYSYVSNVDRVRATGAELVVDWRELLPRLDLSASGTILDARILALSGAANATATPGAAVGKFLPNIPRRRATFVATYRPSAAVSVTLAGRYSDPMYTTLDNADTHPNTYQGFEGWFVADAKGTWRVNSAWSASLGVDNMLNRKYFLFHPFPQRTLVGSLTYAF